MAAAVAGRSVPELPGILKYGERAEAAKAMHRICEGKKIEVQVGKHRHQPGKITSLSQAIPDRMVLDTNAITRIKQPNLIV